MEWEYAQLSCNASSGDTIIELNRMGKQGWELVGFIKQEFGQYSTLLFIFKRIVLSEQPWVS